MQPFVDVSKHTPNRTVFRYLIPLGIIAFCVLAYFLSTQFDRVPPILKRGMQPSDFPQLIIGLIIILSVWLIFRDNDKTPKRMTKVVHLTMGLLVGFLIIADIDLFLGLGLFATMLTILWGEKRAWAIIFVGLFVPFAVFFFFDSIFEVRFPRGLLTNLWYG